MTEPTCKTCRFFKFIQHDDACGMCRVRSVLRWPVRGADEWCGEHEPNASEPPVLCFGGESSYGYADGTKATFPTYTKSDVIASLDQIPDDAKIVSWNVIQEKNPENRS